MADPITISAGIAIAGTAAGGIIGGLGASQTAAAQASMYQYKAGVAMLNKQINEQNANFAVESGDVKAEETGLEAGQKIAETKVVQAASGFDVTTGTNVAVRDSQTAAADYDQNVIRWDASKTAWGFQAKATTDEAEANLDTMAASNAQQGGLISELTSFIGAGTSVATKWSQGIQQGAFKNPFASSASGSNSGTAP